MLTNYDKIREHDVQRAWLTQILSQIQSCEWFGTLTIKLEKGMIKRIDRSEVLLPGENTDKLKAHKG